MARVNVRSEYRELVKLFNKLTGSRGMWQVFNDCIELFALSLQNQFVFGKKHEENENRYQQIITEYTKPEQQVVIEIFAELVNMAAKDPFRDLLGDLYMQLNMGSDALGQFFTPYSVSYSMAVCSISMGEIKKKIQEKGYITVNEPACGGGANVIAFCEYLHKNNINYQSDCVVVCQELSRLTALMCYVVLSLLGCSAVIKVGDSLLKPYTRYCEEVKKGAELWTTPMFHLNNCYLKV